MELADAIRKRRAVRTYTDRPVDDETLDRLLRLGLRAPSGGGQQAWGLLVVRDPASAWRSPSSSSPAARATSR